MKEGGWEGGSSVVPAEPGLFFFTLFWFWELRLLFLNLTAKRGVEVYTLCLQQQLETT